MTNLELFRLQKKYTLPEMAQAIGVSASVLKGLENKVGMITPKRRQLLETYFKGFSLEKLWEDVPPPTPDKAVEEF